MSDRLRDFLRIVGTGGILMGMFLLGAAGLLLYGQKKATRGWLSTTGEIVSGTVYSEQGTRPGHRGTMYGARWLIRYKLGDSVYDSTANAGFDMRDRDEMQRVVDSRPPGTKVEILFDPEDNARIALAQGVVAKSSPVVSLIEAGSVCFLVGVLLIVVVPKFVKI